VTCRELLQRFIAALERDRLDLEAFRKLVNKCGAFGVEALKALARKGVQFAAAQAWAYYRGSVIAGRDPAAAYGRAVGFIWWLVDWYEMPCGVLAEMAAYAATAAARYNWPAKWPFLVPAAVAAEENGCELPDGVAEALGPDEFAKLESFLEQEEAVVEVAPGWKVALVKDGRHVVMVI
jgi:hypothetical protein